VLQGNAQSQELQFRDVQGSSRVGLVYAYDQDFAWLLTFTSTLSSDAIKNVPEKITWNIVELNGDNRGVDLFPQSKSISKSALLVGQLKVEDRGQIKKILLNQKNVRVEFRLPNSTQSLFHINIARICSEFAGYVKDLSHSGRKVCDVDPNDLSDVQFCKDSETELRKFISDNLLSCDIAKQIHQDRGCGRLMCQ